MPITKKIFISPLLLSLILGMGLVACASKPATPAFSKAADVQGFDVAASRVQNSRALDGSRSAELSPDEQKQAPVQAVTLTFAQVSEDLGMPSARLEKQARLLGAFIENGRLARGICEDDEDLSTEKLCAMIDSYRSNATAGKSYSSKSGRRVPIRPQHFNEQQRMSYGRLMKSMSREPAERVLVWSPRLLMTPTCPRNLSAAAIRKLETLLPSPVARNMMEKLYEHATACLRQDEEGFEATHFRQALLRHLWGDEAGARKAINKALTATDSDERSRVLYWAGFLQNETAQKNFFWKRLTDEYPLSFHALEVWQHKGQDPMSIFASRPPLTLNRKTLGAENELDASLRWLEALYIIGKGEAAQKLARWISKNYKEELTPSTILYISLLKSSKGSPFNTITFLTRQVSENPALINRQTLNIIFPRPYFDIFDRLSPSTDPFLLLSVARQESGFNPRARSHMNAQGLLQLLPSTARRLSGKRKNNLYDTEVNATLGGKFMAQLIERFESVELALAAYNAGPGRVDEWKERFATSDLSLMLDLIPFKETRNYVSIILRNNYWYERLYRNDPGVNGRSIAQSSGRRSDIVTRLVAAHSRASYAKAHGGRMPAAAESF